jgi:hypothetical protein
MTFFEELNDENTTGVAIKNIQFASENNNIILISPVGLYNIDALTSSVHYVTAAATANININVRGSSTLSLNSTLLVGQSVTVTYLMTVGFSPFTIISLQVDGSTQIINWVNNITPPLIPSCFMSFTFTILKKGSGTYTVLGSVTRYG